MKIMFDTNVLISAFVYDKETGHLVEELFDSPHELYVSEYIDREFQEKLNSKCPEISEKVYSEYRKMAFNFCKSTDQKLGELRDPKDIPVLSDAIYHKADVILTGDKDFLEADLQQPLVFSPGELKKYLAAEK